MVYGLLAMDFSLFILPISQTSAVLLVLYVHMQSIIQVKGLTKSFKNLTAVKELSFTVQEGDVYGFLGQNGAGKSTTIRMLLTLIQPTAGSIELFGMPLHSHRTEILRQVGAVIEKRMFINTSVPLKTSAFSQDSVASNPPNNN